MSTIDLANIKLAKGAHGDCDDPERCLFEWYNWLTRQRHTDSCPPGVSPVLHAFGMRLNDRLPDTKRQELKRFLPNGTDRLAGTANDGRDDARALIATNWALHSGARAWLAAAGLDDEAAEIDAIPVLTDQAALDTALPAIRGIRDRLWTKRATLYTDLRAKVRAELAKTKPAAAVAAADAAAAAVAAAVAAAAADADAAADAVAAAVAVAVAVAVADADAAAAAAADAAAAAGWSTVYSKTYTAAYTASKKAIDDKFSGVIGEVEDSAIALFDTLVAGEWPTDGKAA